MIVTDGIGQTPCSFEQLSCLCLNNIVIYLSQTIRLPLLVNIGL